MNENEKDLEHFRGVLSARLRTGLGERSSRPGAIRPSEPAASSAPEMWADGKTPKDPELAVLACGVSGEPFDEERFAIDSSYQARADVQAAAAKLTEIRRAKRAKAPHSEIVKTGPTQSEYEEDKGALLKAERRERLLSEIAAAQERLDAMEGGDE